MTEICSFRAENGEGGNVIERLSEALEMAKSGQLSNVVIVMVDRDDCVYHGWANGNKPSLILGEMYCAMNEFMMAHTQRRG